MVVPRIPGAVAGRARFRDDLRVGYQKANGYNTLYQELLEHCRDVLQVDLEMVARAASELEEQRAQLNELFMRVPDAVVIVDRDSRIERSSRYP